MANVRSIIGYNRQGSAVNKLLAAYGNDIVDVLAGTGFGLALSANAVDLKVFLDSVFLQNYDTRPITYNGTTWSTNHVGRAMTAKYQYPFKERMYLGGCKFTNPQAPQDIDGNTITFESRVFYSDLFQNNQLTWGLEWGRNGSTIAGTDIFQLDNTSPIVQDFVVSNIKVGDPLFITNGNPVLTNQIYFVSKVESSYRLRVTDLSGNKVSFDATATGQHFWVGSNWFDVQTNNNDQLMGFGDNNDRLVMLKQLSAHFYTGPVSNIQRQIKRSRGTSSSKSIITDEQGNLYWFHGSQLKLTGIYMYDGVNAIKISRAIDPYIQGMSASNYANVVGWVEGNELRWFIGDIANNNYGISMSNAVVTFNVDLKTWDVSPIADVITSSTTWITSNQQNSYCGTADDEILKMSDGNSFNTAPIPFVYETKVIYPDGSQITNEFPYVGVVGRATRGVKVKYKLWDVPKRDGSAGVDDQWLGLGECTDDKTELTVPPKHNQGAGIQFRFEEDGTLENDIYIEELTVYYRPDRTRLV